MESGVRLTPALLRSQLQWLSDDSVDSGKEEPKTEGLCRSKSPQWHSGIGPPRPALKSDLKFAAPGGDLIHWTNFFFSKGRSNIAFLYFDFLN